MKKTVIRIFAMLLAAIMVLSLAVTAFAAELDLSRGNSFNNDMALESVQNASSGGDLGVFSLKITDGSQTLYFSAFLLEVDGNVYLVTGGGFSEALSQFSMTLISSGAGGYAQKASVLGEDYYFTYLSATGLDQFVPLSLASSDSTDVTLYLENGGQGLGSADLDLSQIPKYTLNGTNDVAYIDGTSESDYMFIGVPFVDRGTLNTVAIGVIGANPEGGDNCLWVHTILYADPDTAYSLGTTNGGSSGNNGGGNSGNNGGGNSGNNGNNGGNNGNSGGGFEFKPIYLLGIAAVAVIIFLIVRANSKGGTNGSNVGTVALEQTSAAPTDSGATLPLDPNQGTLPLDPNANVMPVATAWQLRAVGGSFNGQTFPISGTLRLGRAPQCQVVFPAGTPGISSNHCEVALEGGSVVLRDLGSSYGTFCKGNKLAPHSNCYLNPGDSFTMAQGQTFQLEAAGAPAQSNASIAVRDAQGRDYRTGSGRMSFGRGDGNKVRFPADDKGVSSNHCVLYRENGKLYLMDVGSTNGTFLNDKERLQPNVPYRIRKGTAFYLTNRKNTFVVTED